MRAAFTALHFLPMYRFCRLLSRPILLSGLVALILTGLLYGDALALPLFSDDLVQIPWLESVSWFDLWTSSSPYGYYRPVWYSLWRVLGACAGGLRPLPLHLANLLAHWAAAWLAGILAVRWIATRSARNDGRPVGSPVQATSQHVCAIAVVATSVFAAFPFARQAVAWPGAVYNPLVSAFASGAVILYDDGRLRRRPVLIAWAMLLSALAPFAYEGGLMIGPLLVMVEAIGRLGHRWPQRRSAWPLLAIITTAGTLVVWSAVRGSAIGDFGLHVLELSRNVGFLVQGLVYPAAPLGQALASSTGLPPIMALWLIAIPTLAIVVLGAWRTDRQALLLGLGWFGLFALPPLATMQADWFALAPRFLYTTAGGIALLWAAASASWCDCIIQRRGAWISSRAVIAILITILLVAPAASFVRRGMGLYKMAGRVIWDAARAGAEMPPALFVNLPRQITPVSRTYPLGYEGVTPLPQRVTVEQLVYVNAGVLSGGEAVAFGIVAPDTPPSYSYELHGREVGWEEVAEASRRARIVHIAEYSGDAIRLREAGGPGDSRSLAGMPAVFEGRIGVRGTKATCDSSGHVRLAVTWQTENRIETDVTVFAHLVDAVAPDTEPQAQADGYPLMGMKPFWLFEQSEAVRDVRYFSGVPPGLYQIRIGVWEPASGHRWSTEEGETSGTLIDSVSCP